MLGSRVCTCDPNLNLTTESFCFAQTVEAALRLTALRSALA